MFIIPHQDVFQYPAANGPGLFRDGEAMLPNGPWVYVPLPLAVGHAGGHLPPALDQNDQVF